MKPKDTSAEEDNADGGGIQFKVGEKKPGEELDNLTEECVKIVHEAFDSFDIDHSDAIDIDECYRHWGAKGFGKLSAKEFMKTVDMDGNGEIEFDEFY